MSFSSNFDPKKIADQVTKEALEEVKRKNQPVLDSVFRQCQGKSVEEVEPVLGAALRNADWTLSSKELRDYAKAISDGHRIVLR